MIFIEITQTSELDSRERQSVTCFPYMISVSDFLSPWGLTVCTPCSGPLVPYVLMVSDSFLMPILISFYYLQCQGRGVCLGIS